MFANGFTNDNDKRVKRYVFSVTNKHHIDQRELVHASLFLNKA